MFQGAIFPKKENAKSNIKVLYEGKDVTPKHLEYSYLETSLESLQIDDHEKDTLSSKCDATDNAIEGELFNLDKEIEIVDEAVRKDKPGMEIPTKLVQNLKCGILKILLRETRTMKLLHIDSITSKKEYSQSCMDTHLKVVINGEKQKMETVSSETQTLKNPMRDQSTITVPVMKKDCSTYVSNWDLYCSSLDKNKASPKGTNMSRKNMLWSKFEKLTKMSMEDEVSEIFKKPKFIHASIISERLLATNNFSGRHSLFLGDSIKGGKVSQFKYKVEKLWAFSCEKTQQKTVTSLSWNSVIEGNVAVGYGTFDFCNPTEGLLCIWSILNPCQPEQTHKFQCSVTNAKFSKKHPHIIAVGCYDGSIWIVDISLNSKIMIDGHQLHHLGPVWKLDWVLYDDLLCKEEHLVSIGNDGRVCKWDISNKLGCSLLLWLRYSPEKQLKPLIKEDMMIGNHYLSGLSFTVDPESSDMYYVGTKEGFLVKCSTNLHDGYIDIMMAHQGPIYSVQFSPFSTKIILTCGGDWSMRLWITGVKEPILIIRTAMEAVMHAVWSPVHSTIIVSISGNELALWDISRKMVYPLTIVTISSNLLFSTVQFTSQGDNIIAGDDDGNVHVFNLQEMPHSPYHQEKYLIDSLKMYLKSKPNLLAEMEKLMK